jgi:hypothetical protein
MTAPTLGTFSPSQTIGGSGLPNKGIGRVRQVLYAEQDIAAWYTAGGTSTQSSKLVLVPADSEVIIHAVLNITTLVGTSFSLGDSSDQAYWVSANSTTTINTSATLAHTSKVYTAADYISFMSTTGTSGVVGVFYEIVDLTRDQIALVP